MAARGERRNGRSVRHGSKIADPSDDRTSVEGQSLYLLLGVAEDSDAEHLRAAYEGAVAAATARGDWARAGALSAAFDALPRSVRLAVYDGRERNAERWATRQADARAVTFARRRPANRLPVIMTVGLIAVVAVLAGAKRFTPQPTATDSAVMPPTPSTKTAAISNEMPSLGPNRATASPTPAAATWSPMRALYPGVGVVQVPLDALVGADGLAQVSCPDQRTGASWHRLKVRPGQQFICPSGFVGQVLVPGAR